jgi:hypothetical protein
MKHRNSKGRRLAILAGGTVAGVLLSGTAAVAYWSVTGTGSGSAASSTMVAPTVSAGTANGTLLYPGLTADGSSAGGDLAVSVTNPNAFAVTVTLTQGGQPAECSTPAISLVSSPALTVAVPAGATVDKTFHHVVSMGDSSNDCQGKTLTIPLTSSSTSN